MGKPESLSQSEIEMSENNKTKRFQDIVSMAQIMSVSLIWVLVVSVTIWLAHMLRFSIELKDVPGFSVGISLIAVPIFWTLAGVLTYVFVGLRRNRTQDPS